MCGHLSSAGAWIAFLVALGSLASPGLANEPSRYTPPGASAETLTLAALEAEVAGDSARREALLRQALEADPEYAPARWHSGCVRVEGKWLSPEEAARRATGDGTLAEYRRLRSLHAGTPTGEVTLARWCRKNGLEAEARVHWLGVLRFQPQHEEALKNLGMRWQQGRLVTLAQVKDERAKQAESRQQEPRRNWVKHWEPLVLSWRRAIQRGDADVGKSISKELAAVRSPAMMATLDVLVQKRSRSKEDEKANQALGLALVEALDPLPQPWAVQSLVRHAVDHPVAEVRTAAADALGHRPKESYVPWLLARMRSPIEAEAVLVAYPDGGMSYQHSFYQQGLDADVRVTQSQSFRFAGRDPPVLSLAPEGVEAGIRAGRIRPGYPASVAAQGRANAREAVQASVRSRMAAAAQADQIQRRVDGVNAVVIDTNRRIRHALARATGVDLAADPISWARWWRDYWYDYFDLEQPQYSERIPVYDVYYSKSYRYVLPAPPSPGAKSCFPRGTKVTALAGAVPIEEIKVGDRVLSQDPRSGELAFKPVLGTTVRNPSARVRIALGPETITATRGHPFWALGEGWKMAKQLSAGSRLHTLSGAVAIDAVEELPPAEPWEAADTASYNLIVDEFHTYFVGDRRVLVHDNVLFPFDGSLGPVPGLVP